MPRFALALFALTSFAVAAPVPKKKPPFYPHALGTKWEYVEYGIEQLVSVEEVTEVETKNGVTTFKVEYATNGGAKEWEKYRIDGDELAVLGGSWGEYSEPVVLRKRAWKAGDSWECKYTLNKVEHEETVSVGEAEEVTTPAGKFTAFPISRTFTEPKKLRVCVLWYAEGVGMVRKETVGKNRPEQELKAFTPGNK